jgi:hypothetical protein
MNQSLRRCFVLAVVCCTMMVSARQGAFAAPRKGSILDVFTGDTESWGTTSTLTYGKNEAILVDSQLRTSQAPSLICGRFLFLTQHGALI